MLTTTSMKWSKTWYLKNIVQVVIDRTCNVTVTLCDNKGHERQSWQTHHATTRSHFRHYFFVQSKFSSKTFRVKIRFIKKVLFRPNRVPPKSSFVQNVENKKKRVASKVWVVRFSSLINSSSIVVFVFLVLVGVIPVRVQKSNFP